ncbi:hypothetical protein EC988_001246 [Linderina pennispora]|nr:hypothetical protein EC988_001246 [Linderina pennispora]
MPAAAAVSRLARNRQAEEQPLDQMMAQLETDDNEEVATATEEPVQQAKRRGRPPKKKAAAETGGSQVPGKKMPPKEATRRGRGRRTKHTEAHGAGAAADDIGDVSMAHGKQPAARRRKTILEMDAELRTQPARKRGSKKGPQQRQSEEGESAEPRIGDTQETLAADEPRAPSPKRKRMGKTAITLGPVSSEGTGAGAALKKKRKLNLKRIQTILGGNGQAKAAPSRPAAETASNPMALKFSVPKIRSKPQDLGS